MADENKFKIDITSGVAEQLLEGARSFLEKLMGPAVEEIGLLMADQVTQYRFKRQVQTLNKTKAYCDSNHITTKAISLKILFPLLEHAGLEDDDYLQDKWAILLGNLVDSEQNIENHVFPYLLSQISNAEFAGIEGCVIKHLITIRSETAVFEELSTKAEPILKQLHKQILKLDEIIAHLRSRSPENPDIEIELKTRTELINKSSSISVCYGDVDHPIPGQIDHWVS